MNKFLLGLGSVVICIGGWLYARGMGEGFSEHGGDLNRPFDNSVLPREDRPLEQRPLELRPEERHEEHRDFGRAGDNRSQWERDEHQGDNLFKEQTDKNQPLQAITPTKAPLAATPAQVSSRVRQNYPGMNNWFNGGFWGDHGIANPGIDVWRAANWADANSWLGAGWGSAISYDPNGSSVEVSQPGSASYVATGQDSYMNQPNSNVATADNTSSNLIPLGVYALGTDTVGPDSTNLFLQLATTKEGQIQGTFYNSSTDKTEPVTGSVDKSNQMVSFYLQNRPDSPIISTGLYNLTQGQTPVNVIMPDTSTREWDLVKLNQ